MLNNNPFGRSLTEYQHFLPASNGTNAQSSTPKTPVRATSSQVINKVPTPSAQNVNASSTDHILLKLNAQIEGLRQDLSIQNHMLMSMEKRLDRMEKDVMIKGLEAVAGYVVNDFDTKLRARNHNSAARQANCNRPAGTALVVLHDVSTNKVIDGFPNVLIEVDRLSEDCIDHLMGALGLGISGTLEAKRRLLLVEIGDRVDHHSNGFHTCK